MKIEHAFTWKYEQAHFGRNIEHKVVPSECYKNVKNFCKTYQNLGRNVRVSLGIGLRTWDDGCTFGYHYVVKDADTGEYSDPQYSRYTFVELHSWTPEEYEKDCRRYAFDHGGHPAEEFAFHYVHLFGKQLLAANRFIKSQAYCKGLTDKELKDYFKVDPDRLVIKPSFGQQEIKLMNIG